MNGLIGTQLGRRETERRWFHLAAQRIADESILGATGRLAGGRDGLADLGQIVRRKITLAIGQVEAFGPHETGKQVGPLVGGGSADDAVEVIRKALRLHESLLATLGTSDEVRVGRRA